MKKILTEEKPRAGFAENFFDETDFRAELEAVSHTAARRREPSAGDAFGDALVGSLRLLFIYLPGVALLSLTVIAQLVFFFHGDYAVELALGALGALAVGTFMVMFGLGKMRELRYLKAVGAILAAGALAAAVYGLYSVATGDFDRFGPFWLAAWIGGAIAGLFIKRKLDQAER